jgi:hypothetical protein
MQKKSNEINALRKQAVGKTTKVGGRFHESWWAIPRKWWAIPRNIGGRNHETPAVGDST